MKFSLLGIDITLTKSGKGKEQLDLSDILEVNKNHISYIKALASDDINRRILAVCRSPKESPDRFQECLDENGIVVIPGFIPESRMNQIAPIVSELRGRVEQFIGGDDSILENPTVLFQKGTAKLSGYQALSTHEKAVVQVRYGQDHGMVDIFNVDQWRSELGDLLRPFFEDSEVLKIMKSGSGDVEARNLNLYINSGVEKTRGFHVDSYSRQLKGFIYLEDCLSLDDGPYTYVRGSHQSSAYTRVNKQISSVLPNATETPTVALESIIPILAKRGALVISDQGGSHRGFPQRAENKRVVAVMNYR